MLFQREARHLLGVLLAVFALMALAAAYWSVSGSTSLLERQDNPRLVEAEAVTRRGAIYDRSGQQLVNSASISDNIGGAVERIYAFTSMYGALGYYSQRYGVSGVEAAYNTLLNGAAHAQTVSQALEDELLNRPREGDDILVTLDLEIQHRLAERMAGTTGAGVVIDVPSGGILALVSLPTYDPNTLDADWDQLVTAPGHPFFNRAIQGRYQPGSALQTTLMAAASLVGYPLDTQFANATEPVQLDDLSLQCAVRLPDRSLTLSEAYSFACPAPFASLADDLGAAIIQATFDTFRLHQTPTILGYVTGEAQTSGTPAPAATPISTPSNDLRAAALGQSSGVVSPLMMGIIAAGIANDGNAPQPYLLWATRPPDDPNGDWQRAPFVSTSVPIATQATARQLQDFMRAAVANGAAQNAGRSGIDIGGHASIAYAGDETHVWFIGFATLSGGRSVAVAIVMENNADPGLAADIGGDVLAVAHERMSLTGGIAGSGVSTDDAPLSTFP